jgi:hypothetical protein
MGIETRIWVAVGVLLALLVAYAVAVAGSAPRPLDRRPLLTAVVAGAAIAASWTGVGLDASPAERPICGPCSSTIDAPRGNGHRGSAVTREAPRRPSRSLAIGRAPSGPVSDSPARGSAGPARSRRSPRPAARTVSSNSQHPVSSSRHLPRADIQSASVRKRHLPHSRRRTWSPGQSGGSPDLLSMGLGVGTFSTGGVLGRSASRTCGVGVGW